jgi:hypothetical protein
MKLKWLNKEVVVVKRLGKPSDGQFFIFPPLRHPISTTQAHHFHRPGIRFHHSGTPFPPLRHTISTTQQYVPTTEESRNFPCAHNPGTKKAIFSHRGHRGHRVLKKNLLSVTSVISVAKSILPENSKISEPGNRSLPINFCLRFISPFLVANCQLPTSSLRVPSLLLAPRAAGLSG